MWYEMENIEIEDGQDMDKMEKKVSRRVKRYEKYGRIPSWIVKRYGKYRRK